MNAVDKSQVHTVSSADVLDVICNILPIRLRIQELCTREFMRILRIPITNTLQSLLSSSSVLRNKFTSMSYLKYTACDVQRSIRQFEVEKESKCTADNILTDINSRCISSC